MSIVVDNVLYAILLPVELSSRVTIRDVAARAGVSVATVSKVINRRYGVAAGTSARVQAVIDDLGYEASLVAQSLRNHRTNVIGILVADLEPFSTELLKGAADAIHTGQSGLPTIDSDNLRGGQLATEHLLGLGHRRIAMLTGRPDLQSAQLREQGYREALSAAGVPADENLILVGDYDPQVSIERARHLLRAPDPPTAVFAANDMSAIATIEAATELGLRVPADLSVVGFDNIPESALCTPPLTTINQPIRRMGEQSIQLLLRLMRGDHVEATHLTLATDLVVRQSTQAV